MKSAPAIACELTASRGLTVAAIFVALLAGIAVSLSGFDLWAKGLIEVLIVIAVWWELGRYRHPRYVRLQAQGDGWTLVDAAGRSVTAELRDHRRLGAFVQMQFAVDGRSFRHLLTPDNSEADTRRRLILLLTRQRNAAIAQAMQRTP